MNNQLERLIRLQEIDAKLLALNRVIGEFPAKISRTELLLSEAQKSLEQIKHKIASLEKEKRKKEKDLEDIDEKIRKLRSRTADIKTNKEYQALLKEIEAIEKDRSSVEDALLSMMVEIDTISKQVHTEETRFRGEKEKVEASKKKLEQEKAEFEKELESVKGVRSQAADTLDQEIYDQYIELIEIYKGLAVTEAKEEICLGCNMNIPPQLFVELKKNEEIMFCPQCRRILYYKNST